MSSARSVSAATSLPKPGALAPDGMGRSSAPVAKSSEVLARAAVARAGLVGDIRSVLICTELCGRFRRSGYPESGRDPIRSQALAQAGEHFQSGIAVGRRNAGLTLEIAHRHHREIGRASWRESV